MLGWADAAPSSSDDLARSAVGRTLPHRDTPGRPDRNVPDTPIDVGGGHERERVLRREVGPTAWAVLADLCLDARSEAAVVVVATSARRAAANIGIGKDAAARASRRLMAAGALSRLPQRSNADGRFTHSIYELHLELPAPRLSRPAEPDTGDQPCPGAADTGTDEPAPVSASSGAGVGKSSPSRGRPRALANQLSFLDAGGDARKLSLETT